MKNKISILILINVRWWNATAFYAINIARIMHDHGHKVIIGCNPKYPAYKKALSYGLNVKALNFYGFNPFRLLFNYMKLIKLVHNEKISVINPHRSEDHFFALMAKFFTRAKIVLTRGDQRSISDYFLSRIQYRLTDSIIITCQSIYKNNRKFFNRIHRKPHVLYGSIHEDLFQVKKSKKDIHTKYKIPKDHLIIGIIGRTDIVKDQYTFLKAAAVVNNRFPKTHFLITGKEERIKFREIKKIAKLLEVNLLLLPLINHLPDVMNFMDIGIITSINSETISRVLLEYMYLKKPVIGTTTNVIGEIIESGNNGEKFDPKDHKQLSQLIIKLIMNKKLREKYSKNSRIIYDQKYSENEFYDQYIRVLNKAVNR
jgi:glycosyltransferase involved in cell wall biosynthesis